MEDRVSRNATRSSSMLLGGKSNKKGIFAMLGYNFKNLSLSTQLITYFIAMFLFFFILLVYIKLNQIVAIFNSQNEVYYYKGFIKNFLENQQEFKANVTQSNIVEDSKRSIRDSVLISVYSQELINHNLADIYPDGSGVNQQDYTWSLPSFTNLDGQTNKLINLFKTEYDLKFSLNYDFSSKFQNSVSSSSSKAERYLDPNLLTPIVWLFIPVLLQDAFVVKPFEKELILSSYFISYEINPTTSLCLNQNHNTYFKYPSEANSTLTYYNSVPYDLILDPVGTCVIDSFLQDTYRKDLLRKENFFMNFERYLLSKPETSFSDMIVLNNILGLLVKKDYILTTSAFTKKLSNTRTMVFAFVFKLNHVITKSNNFFSIIEYNIDKNVTYQVSKGENKETNFYYVNYNIDDSGRFIYNIPDFLDNLWSFSNTLNLQYDQKVTDSIIGFKSNYLNKYSTLEYNPNINTNYYLQFDEHFFNYISFMNNYTKSLEVERKTYCSNIDKVVYNKTLTDFLTFDNNHIDCFKETCKIMNCDTLDPETNTTFPALDPYQIDKTRMIRELIPNCFCLPLFCFEDNVSNSLSPLELNKLDPSSKNVFYGENIPKPYALLKETFLNKNYSQALPGNDRLPKECSIKFNRISTITDKQPYPYMVKTFYDKFYFSNNSNVFTVYLVEQYNLDQLIKFQQVETGFVEVILVCGYIVCLLGIAIGVVYLFYEKILVTILRINRFDKIQKRIISNEQMNIKTEGKVLTMTSFFTENHDVDGDEDAEDSNKVEHSKNLANLQLGSSNLIIPRDASGLGMNLNNDVHDIPEVQNGVGEVKAIDNEDNNDDNADNKDDEKKSILDKKTHKNKTSEISDELTELRKIFYNNLDSFKIEIDINQNFYKDNKLIINFLKEKKMNLYNNIVFQTTEDIQKKLEKQNVSDNDIDNPIPEGNYSTYSENFETNDMNLLLLYEVLSTELIDFSQYRQNFFFKEPQVKQNDSSMLYTGNGNGIQSKIDYTKASIFNFYPAIDKFLYDDENNINDITNGDKITSWISYYMDQAHNSWIKKYDLQTKNY